MATNVTICVGTLGQGIWRSGDGGETWTRVRQGLYSESAVRAIAVHLENLISSMRALRAGSIGVRIKVQAGSDWTRR